MNEMKELISKLKEADHAYYDLDEPIMSDREYNQLYEELETLYMFRLILIALFL